TRASASAAARAPDSPSSPTQDPDMRNADDEDGSVAPMGAVSHLGVPSAIGMLLVLSGCGSVGPDFHRPDPAMQASWSVEGDPHIATKAAPDVAWWTVFGDARLDRLVDIAYGQ